MQLKGKVVRLLIDKNFGFIQDESAKEYFFHRDDFDGHWADLCTDYKNNHEIEVEFDSAKEIGKGPRAANVGRIKHPDMAR